MVLVNPETYPLMETNGTDNGTSVQNCVLTSTDTRKEIKSKEINGGLPRSYGRWDPATQGATLVWRDVCVYAKGGPSLRPFKRIINTATGAVQPGCLVALMGSSGAGKSTLMAALAYRSAGGTIVEGDILVNGRPVGPYMHRLSGFVHQEDLFVGTLTVLEHLTFMARLKLDRRTTNQERRTAVAALIHRAGLGACQNTRIGLAGDGKVLSGGEKKRLAFATELLTEPAILFCDEPTTGLDSFSAQQLVATLQELAARGTTILCTIHQPSSAVFAMFHEVLLLAEGRVAFMGPPNEAIEFFDSHGYHCPDHFNPAEHLVRALACAPGSERNSLRASRRLCDLFAVSESQKRVDMLVQLELHMAESSQHPLVVQRDDFRAPLWPSKLFWLTHRTILQVKRDPSVQALRILQKIAIGIMAGLCFAGSVSLTQPGVQSVQGTVFILVSENTFTPLYSVLAMFPQGFPLFLREYRSGLYYTGLYYLSTMIAMLPGLIVEPVIFVLIGYWLAGLRATLYSFLMTALTATLTMNVSTACGCFFSTAFDSVPLAMAVLVPFDYVLMVTSGMFVKLATLPGYVSWAQYLSWLMYSTEAMSIVQWQGVQNITCDPSPDLPCLTSGAEVLERFSFSEDHLTRDLVAMGVLYACFHLLGFVFLWLRTKKT